MLMLYKQVGDNIDNEVHPRQTRSDYQTRSLHYFHTYAVRDRTDISSCSDVQAPQDLSKINLLDILPSTDLKTTYPF